MRPFLQERMFAKHFVTVFCAPGQIWTVNRQIRNLVLYPIKLRAHVYALKQFPGVDQRYYTIKTAL